jgi:hypothetical protein
MKGDWTTSLDLKSAFNHMLVNEAFIPYLAFRHRGRYYAHAAMPFGARHSPRVFTRALGYTMAYIRVHWQARIIAYMDDVLLLHQDKAHLERATLQIACCLQSLGWTLSQGKCELTPQLEITFLGWR